MLFAAIIGRRLAATSCLIVGMISNRKDGLGDVFATGASCSDSTTNHVSIEESIPPTALFHEPPPAASSDHSPKSVSTDYYNDNETEFGKILNGDIEAIILSETDNLLAFQDHRPQSPLHALIIPKQRIRTVHDLRPSHLPLLYEMKQLADDLVLKYIDNCTSSIDSDVDECGDSSATSTTIPRLVFHIPPFFSVDHLHLHVLAPVPSLSFIGRVKYYDNNKWWWCVSWQSVVDCLERCTDDDNGTNSPTLITSRRFCC